MNTTRIKGLIQKATISFLFATAVVLLLGAITPNEAAAWTRKANGVSVKDRVQAQSDLCWAGGGTATVGSGVFRGISTTTCNGGVHDGQKCVNTKTKTTCTQTRTVLIGDSELGQAITDGLAIAPEPATSPEDTYVDEAPVTDPAVAPEPIAPPEEDAGNGIDQDVVTEDEPAVAPEPTSVPEDSSTGMDQGAVIEEAPAVNPGTEGGAPATDKGGVLDVVVGDGGAVIAPDVDEQQ